MVNFVYYLTKILISKNLSEELCTGKMISYTPLSAQF